MTVYRIFTIASGSVSVGARVGKFTLKGAETTIPAILVGESGRGRSLGILPVQLPNELYNEWQEKGACMIYAAEVGQTKAGKPKLFAKEAADSAEKLIAVMPTKIGFRGSNSHTGDRTGETEKDWRGEEQPKFHPFPGETLVEGKIAEGAAGAAGSGSQLVAVLPKGVVFRTRYGGRLYGAPSAHYYVFDGEKVLAVTWDERQAADIFDEIVEASAPQAVKPEDSIYLTGEAAKEFAEALGADNANPTKPPMFKLNVTVSAELLERLAAAASEKDPEAAEEARGLLPK